MKLKVRTDSISARFEIFCLKGNFRPELFGITPPTRLLSPVRQPLLTQASLSTTVNECICHTSEPRRPWKWCNDEEEGFLGMHPTTIHILFKKVRKYRATREPNRMASVHALIIIPTYQLTTHPIFIHQLIHSSEIK